jgi:hypothetical protein
MRSKKEVRPPPRGKQITPDERAVPPATTNVATTQRSSGRKQIVMNLQQGQIHSTKGPDMRSYNENAILIVRDSEGRVREVQAWCHLDPSNLRNDYAQRRLSGPYNRAITAGRIANPYPDDDPLMQELFDRAQKVKIHSGHPIPRVLGFPGKDLLPYSSVLNLKGIKELEMVLQARVEMETPTFVKTSADFFSNRGIPDIVTYEIYGVGEDAGPRLIDTVSFSALDS